MSIREEKIMEILRNADRPMTHYEIIKEDESIGPKPSVLRCLKVMERYKMVASEVVEDFGCYQIRTWRALR